MKLVFLYNIRDSSETLKVGYQVDKSGKKAITF